MDTQVTIKERERTTFKAWVTTYALTDGIIEHEVEDCFDISDDMVRTVGDRYICIHGHNWHRTEAEAIKRAKEMQAAKLRSIDKQRARIAALKF